MLVRIANRLRRKGIVFGLQTGIAQKDADPLLKCDQFLVSVLPQPGGHCIEFERLVEVFLAN
jgi:hypothetical protein